MNFALKVALIRKFGSQINAVKPLGIDEPTLSRIVRGHRNPTPAQRETLKKALGKDYFRRGQLGVDLEAAPAE
jgi:hypothetical protein